MDGGFRAIVTDAAANVYALATENPVRYADVKIPQDGPPLCTVYGCDGLTVRKFGPEGALLWEYQHREDTSFGTALALDSEGRLWVGGSRLREERVALLLRFDRP